MTENNLHDQVLALIRKAEAKAYERGKADAKRELLAFLSARDADIPTMPAIPASLIQDDTSAVAPSQDRQRAPRGIVRKFINRVLGDHAQSRNGLPPSALLNYAETEFEKMIKLNSIRSELRIGRDDGRYHDENGRWFLVGDGEEKVEAGTADNETPASLSLAAEGR